jgi:16S rRNA (guanine(966)-N(2))-methyltransferase RsmD
MRIIGGKYRGKIISPPSNFRSRPTTDFAKEALFNVIGNYFNFENISVLDLFSGTGSISYEFASRGTKNIVAVEKNFIHTKFIQTTIEKLGFNNNIRLIKSNVFRYLKSTKQKFDLIFADPPYDLENIPEIYDLIFKKELLSDKSLLIIEHPAEIDFSLYKHFLMKKTYGSVNFSFFDPEVES